MPLPSLLLAHVLVLQLVMCFIFRNREGALTANAATIAHEASLPPRGPVVILPSPHSAARGRGAMALAALSGDEQLVIFSRLCNVLDPGVAVASDRGI